MSNEVYKKYFSFKIIFFVISQIREICLQCMKVVSVEFWHICACVQYYVKVFLVWELDFKLNLYVVHACKISNIFMCNDVMDVKRVHVLV